jgi:signal transduction histidine kinase
MTTMTTVGTDDARTAAPARRTGALARLPAPPSWLLALAGVVLGGLGARVQSDVVGRSTTFIVVELLVGGILLAVGLLIRALRPTNRCWALLAGTGLLWLFSVLGPIHHEDVALLTFAFGRAYVPLLAWAVLAFPTGRLARRSERALVAAFVGLALLRALGRLLLHVPPDFLGCGCVRNRFLPITDDRWWRLTEEAYAWGLGAAAALMLVASGRRWLVATGAGRRMATPVLVAAAALALAAGHEGIVGWGASFGRTGPRSYEVYAWAHIGVAAAFVAGYVRLRAVRSAIVDVVADLGEGAPPARLQQALARALGDPTLQLVVYADGDTVDVEGNPTTIDDPDPARAVTTIRRDGVPVLALVHDVALLEDPGLVQAVAASVRLATDNHRLERELQDQLAQVAASRARIVAAGDEARRKIERDLHDGAQQRLVAIALNLRLTQLQLGASGDDATNERLETAVDDLAAAIADLRNLARGIHPAILAESGLAAAVRSLADRLPVAVNVDVQLDAEPALEIGAAAYFIIAEALTNVVKHAHASSADVEIVCAGGRLSITVRDDGVGGVDASKGSGIGGLGDRVAAAGGSIDVVSPPGAGTTIHVELPCASS